MEPVSPLIPPARTRAPKLRPAGLPPRYEPVRVIGTGAHGTVWLARDPRLGRLVAVKTMCTECADLLERLRREARLLARLEHPSIVRVHELDHHEGRLFLAMEYLPGGNLALPCFEPRTLVRVVRGVVDALGHAHDQGVVHRDVKPENVLLSGRGEGARAVLADFGLALGPDEGTPLLRRPIVGTPLTMSPEQVEGRALSPASDVFSLGATLYRKLTGQWPFRGRTVDEVFAAIRSRPVEPLRVHAASVPRRLDALVQRMLAKEPRARFGSMAELGAALDRFLRARSLFSFLPGRRSRPSLLPNRIHPERPT
jgi:serine/threonine protein kinase